MLRSSKRHWGLGVIMVSFRRLGMLVLFIGVVGVQEAPVSRAAEPIAVEEPEPPIDDARLALADQLVPLQTELRASFPKQFGGLWIDDKGVPHVAIVGAAPGIVEAAAAAHLEPAAVIEQVRFSESMLDTAMDNVARAVESEATNGVDLEGVDLALISLSLQDNRILFSHRNASPAALAKLAERFGPIAGFRETNERFTNVACTGRTNCGGPVRAGIQLYRNNGTATGRSTACMSAFVIKDLVMPPRYSILSAGHCDTQSFPYRYHPTTTYLGNTAGINAVYANGADVMRIPIPASQASNKLYITSTVSRSVTSSATTTNEVIGSQVCSSKLSGNDCGTLLSKNVCSDGGAICGLRLASSQYACGGDSGSPVYQTTGTSTARALGIMQGASTGTYTCPNGDKVGSSSVYSHINLAVPALGRFLVVTSAP